jgi:SAM-dependent methyltransferase
MTPLDYFTGILDPVVRLLLRLLPPESRRRLGFSWKYLRNQTPWDTNQTPPEVMDFVRFTEPGRALDLGCGTGTNVLYLARHGWNTTGVDYTERAIRLARTKAETAGVRAEFHYGDVTRLDDLPLPAPFDYLLDIGCLHSLSPEAQERYATQVIRLARPGACYMLYAGLPRPSTSGQIGIEPERVATLFSPGYTLERHQLGEDTNGRWTSAWYWFRRDSQEREART